MRGHALTATLIATGIGAVAGVGGLTAAYADDGAGGGPRVIVGGSTGGDVSGPGDQVSAAERARARAKLAGVTRFWAVGARFHATHAVALERPTVAAVHLHPPYYAQTKGYYCGPASGHMILDQIGTGRSRLSPHRKQSQANLARNRYMATDANGSTTWASDRFRIGLNRWIYGTANGWYVSLDSPSVAQFKSVLRTDIQQRHWSFGADTVEFANWQHYNHHPRPQTIGHWLTVSGFSSYGRTTNFKDPSHSIWPAAHPSMSEATGHFVRTYLQSNGITW